MSNITNQLSELFLLIFMYLLLQKDRLINTINSGDDKVRWGEDPNLMKYLPWYRPTCISENCTTTFNCWAGHNLCRRCNTPNPGPNRSGCYVKRNFQKSSLKKYSQLDSSTIYPQNTVLKPNTIHLTKISKV